MKFSVRSLYKPVIASLPPLALSCALPEICLLGGFLTAALLCTDVTLAILDKRLRDPMRFLAYIGLFSVFFGMVQLLPIGHLESDVFSLAVVSGILLYQPSFSGGTLKFPVLTAALGAVGAGVGFTALSALLCWLRPDAAIVPFWLLLLPLGGLLGLCVWFSCRRRREEWRGCKACPMAGNCALYESVKDAKEEAK